MQRPKHVSHHKISGWHQTKSFSGNLINSVFNINSSHLQPGGIPTWINNYYCFVSRALAPVGVFEPNMCADINSEMCTALVWFCFYKWHPSTSPAVQFCTVCHWNQFHKTTLKMQGDVWEAAVFCVWNPEKKNPKILSDRWQERGYRTKTQLKPGEVTTVWLHVTTADKLWFALDCVTTIFHRRNHPHVCHWGLLISCQTRMIKFIPQPWTEMWLHTPKYDRFKTEDNKEEYNLVNWSKNVSHLIQSASSAVTLCWGFSGTSCQWFCYRGHSCHLAH